jgi:tetratricopeptide (TPR) repeat protein
MNHRAYFHSIVALVGFALFILSPWGVAAAKPSSDEAGKAAASPGRPASDSNPNTSPLPKELLDPKAKVDFIRQQLDTQPLDTLRGMVEKIAAETPTDAPESREAISLLRQALLTMARRSVEFNNHSEAILYYERWRSLIGKADELDPTLAPIFIELGRQYRQVGSALSAVEAFYRAMMFARQGGTESTLHLKTARWEVAETNYMSRSWDRARRLYEMFVETDGGNDFLTHTAYYRIGDCWRAQEEEAAAIVAYERALTHNPSHPFAQEARLGLLQMFLNRSNYDAAMKTLQEFTDVTSTLTPEEMVYWKRRSGEALFRHLFVEQDYERSYEILNSLARMDPSLAWQNQVARWKALVHIQKGEYPKAAGALAMTRQKVDGKEPPPEAVIPNKGVAISNGAYLETCEWILEAQNRKKQLYLPEVKNP